MLRRQDSSLSSSSRHPPTPPSPEKNCAKAIGCMSGIIHLFSKYHKPNRRLTFDRKQEKPKKSSTRNAKSWAAPEEKENRAEKQSRDAAKEALRSPTLPPEIRLSIAARSPDYSSSPCSFVTRLMGLDDKAAEARTAAVDLSEDSVCEKRQLLLQALEKCNEDLEALKRIIRTLQTAELRPIRWPSPKTAAADRGVPGEIVETLETVPCMEKFIVATDHELHSPIRTAVESAPALVARCCFSITMAEACEGVKKGHSEFKPGKQHVPIARFLNRPATTISRVWIKRRRAVVSSLPSSSEAMVRNVEQVCNEIALGEKREIGRILLMLHDHLCTMLIEELVGELKSCPIAYSLPLGACKRRLSF